MKTLKPTILIGLLVITTLACRKDKVKPPYVQIIPTVEPLEYFPAFPGSYWVYKVKESSIDTLKVASEYEICIYNKSDYTWTTPQWDTLMLPKLILNGIYNSNDVIPYAYVREYSISKPTNQSKAPAFVPILLTDQGASSATTYVSQGHLGMVGTFKIDTSLIVLGQQYNNVIGTNHYDIFCSGSGGIEACVYTKEYFAKGVGLVKRESRDHLDSVFRVELELVDYFIKN